MKIFTGQKTNKQLARHGDDFSIANFQTKFPQYFKRHLEFFMVFQNCYVILSLLVETRHRSAEPWMEDTAVY
jgi:hypothetical protein